MIALDSNIIVRFLVRDDEKQAQLVYKRFKLAETRREVLFVPLLVILETIWVLDSLYDLTREKILDSIEELMLMPIFKFQDYGIIQAFLTSSRHERTDLSDLLIAHSCRANGCSHVLTFDKKASKCQMFQLVK